MKPKNFTGKNSRTGAPPSKLGSASMMATIDGLEMENMIETPWESSMKAIAIHTEALELIEMLIEPPH
jgi:hypothetical protein